MKIGIIWKIIGGIILTGSSVAAITLATIKLNSKSNDNNSKQGVVDGENHESSNDNKNGLIQQELVSEAKEESETQTSDNNDGDSKNLNGEKSDQSKEKNDTISFFVEDIKNFENKDYECKFDESTKFDCTVSAISLNKELNHTKINDLETNNFTENNLEKNNIYKVTLNNQNKDISKFDWTKFDIELISKNDSKSIGTLDMLFIMNGKQLYDKNETWYFIFEATKEKTILNNGDDQELTCVIKETNKNTECSIYGFGKTTIENESDKLNNLVFEKYDISETKENEYYLIQLIDQSNATETKNIQIKTNTDNGHDYQVTGAFLYEDVGHLFIMDK